MKLEFTLQIFEKYSNIKFHENLSNGSHSLQTVRGTDRHDDSNSHFPQFCKCA